MSIFLYDTCIFSRFSVRRLRLIEYMYVLYLLLAQQPLSVKACLYHLAGVGFQWLFWFTPHSRIVSPTYGGTVYLGLEPLMGMLLIVRVDNDDEYAILSEGMSKFCMWFNRQRRIYDFVVRQNQTILNIKTIKRCIQFYLTECVEF